MVRWTRRQRQLAADKILDAANLVSAAIVIGWVVGEPTVSVWTLGAAGAVWVTAFALAMTMESFDD